MSYTCLNYHIVFGTKGRAGLIAGAFQERLFSYMAGVAGNVRGKVYAVNGVSDHVHLLVSLPADVSVVDFVRTVKANSSKWVHEIVEGDKGFGWQEGYSAFSVSYSGVDDVVRYIKGQAEHHRRVSFIDELRMFLERHKIEYNAEYL